MIFNLGLFADCSSGSPGEIGVRRSSVTKERIPGGGVGWCGSGIAKYCGSQSPWIPEHSR